MTREWDASTYDALPLPHEAWGAGVLDRLDLPGDGAGLRVLDAGCGTGRDAAALRDRWPGAELVLLDGSERMLERARERLGDSATYVHADLTRPLPDTVGTVDAVMSVAAFHWVGDHRALFAHLAAVLRPGGRLVAECGGAGNLDAMDSALRTAQRAFGIDEDPGEWCFAGVDDTRAELVSADLVVDDVRLRQHPIRLAEPDLLRRYLATVVLGGYAEPLADRFDAFVDAVAEAMTEPVVDYVRLELEATAP
ncbi:class I SAM-dependent methyltransferase [uncultured Nocardioides sp.]|uniref:class I SAM-dependent methyltransferase n=1 Tax=uncultured Nocardioides sp. TaxID=198441 RepID=UPI002603BA31|nr:class I SAM-dependent methyltransferase [uncultured Nocardioides sp.]